MFRSKVCLSLTGATLAENLEVLNKYRNWIDMAELRADYLNRDERLTIRRFPELAKIPCILSIRRTIDGGMFQDGEAARTILFARALAFADQDTRKNFAYIDIESDFYVPSIQDAALAFGTRIIRSCYFDALPPPDMLKKIESMRLTGFEIPKISFTPRNLSDLTNIFRQAENMQHTQYIASINGSYSLPAKVLSSRLNSAIMYTKPKSMLVQNESNGDIDPVSLADVYNFNMIANETKIIGIAGKPFATLHQPVLLNSGAHLHGTSTVYIPVLANRVEEAIEFGEALNMTAITIAPPFKQAVVPLIRTVAEEVGDTGTCNAIVMRDGEWTGHNTSTKALIAAITAFVERKSLFGYKVAIIGGGATAREAAHAVKMLHGKACIFNRTAIHAKTIAETYDFRWASLSEDAQILIENYSDLIIQATTAGTSGIVECENVDPIPHYEFCGHEKVLDCVYNPQQTPILRRAHEAGCKIADGTFMLQLQSRKQFELFTGVSLYENESVTS